jgi:dUTP pyrophosphatase
MGKKGKFIVIYGINNLGKTTQAKLLVNRLNRAGFPSEYTKYPQYGLPPAGKLINDYLREGNPYDFTPREVQLLHYIDRLFYQERLVSRLNEGINIVAEDYFGTALAWGIGSGVQPELLKYLFSHIYKEDLCFLFDGERFTESIETNHKNETNDRLMEKVRRVHYELGSEYNWLLINANSPIDDIHEKLWIETEKLIKNNEDHNSTGEQIFYTANESDNETPMNRRQSPLVMENKVSQIKVERVSPFAKLPTRAYKNDAGLDIYASDCVSILPHKRELIKTGIKMEIPKGFAGLVWDKSSLAREGIHTMAGVIDSGYRGEILINLINLSGDIYHIAPGKNIAQLLIQKVELPEVVEAPVDADTERQDRGFGSSGEF